jgi:KipI family sensor histidine kinase inhibitor
MMTGLDPSAGVKLRAVADRALLVEFENRIAQDISEQVLKLARLLKLEPFAGILEAVPAYRTLMVHYDPLTIDYDSLCIKITPLLNQSNIPTQSRRRWSVPVLYGGEAAPDLKQISKRHSLSEEQIIDIHSSAVYRVYMMGFAPGWTFLGGLDPRLYTPRLDAPRAEAPAGCISIGGQQTLIGGQAMPSGWNLIGQTPERTFAPERDNPFFMQAGDEVAIRRINQEEFDQLSRQVAAGSRISQELNLT